VVADQILEINQDFLEDPVVERDVLVVVELEDQQLVLPVALREVLRHQ
jgi:hypothetical protein